ncbi:MAG: hypothetical protein GY813_13410 [Halieaceae bacterium]|nr:hypothetical protein [Halieaceae bacterium]
MLRRTTHGVALFVAFAGLACGARTQREGSTPTQHEKLDVAALVGDYEPLVMLDSDTELEPRFTKYIDWLVELGVPDATFIHELEQAHTTRLDAIALILHEKAELQEWLKLGHAFEDIMTLEYYQKHYEEVYPVAHRKAMSIELGLLKHFAAKRGFRQIPELAFVLTTPMVEQRKVPVDRFVRRARYNPEFTEAKLTRADFDVATRVFEAGGYRYENREAIVEAAARFVAGEQGER